MATDKNKIAADCWRKGTEAMTRENWDYAIDMFGKSVILVPDNLMYRQTLRGCERKKYKENGTGAKMASVKLMGIKGRIKKARLKKDWAAVDKAAEEGLMVNPWDAQLNSDQAEACEHLGYPDAALFGFQNAATFDRKTKYYTRSFAVALEKRGDYLNAIKCWEHVAKLDPDDVEARGKIGELSTKSVIEKGGYEGAKDTKDVKSGGGSAYDAYRPSGGRKGAAADGPGMDAQKDLERAIRKEPENQNHHIALAEHYRSERRFDEALDSYRTALELSGGDQNVRQEMEDIELLAIRANLDLAKEQLKANPEDADARQNAGALAGELVQREIEVYTARVERYPKDSKLKFELAQRLVRVRKVPQAIPFLQQAASDQRLEVDVLLMLGECFVSEKKNELGLRQFKKVLPKLDAHDRPDIFKKAHYMVGRIYESLGKSTEAEEHFNEVLAIDYEYKDVLQRLEKLESDEGDGDDD